MIKRSWSTGSTVPRQALLVNPGLEQLTLRPAGGTWRPGYAAPFETLGLVPPGRSGLVNTGSIVATAVDVDVEAMGRLPGRAEARKVGPALSTALRGLTR